MRPLPIKETVWSSASLKLTLLLVAVVRMTPLFVSCFLTAIERLPEILICALWVTFVKLELDGISSSLLLRSVSRLSAVKVVPSKVAAELIICDPSETMRLADGVLV